MINLICLKHGTKYSYVYVNKLYNMVKRHLSVPFNFFCFTEDANNINDKVIIKKLPSTNVSGWWYKPYLFSEGLFEKDSINFYLDLDVVIINSMDKLIEYNSSKEFVGLQDPMRTLNPNKIFLNSSVMRWPADRYTDLWSNLKNNTSITSKYKGDQDYIWDLHKNEIDFYPKKWVLSYKWEVRNRNELTTDRPKRFKIIRSPEIDPETSILVFHGNPKVHIVQDDIILNNWI